MKLLSTVAAGALLLAGCAPFEHGHYAADSHFINDFGDSAGTPVLYDTNSDYAATATTIETLGGHHQPHSVPAPAYSVPVQQVSYAPPPVQQVTYAPPPQPVQVFASAPVHHEPHVVEAPRYIEPPRYVEPPRQEYVVHQEPPLPAIPHHNYHPEPPVVQYTPPPVQYVAPVAPAPAPVVAYNPPPVAAATSVSVNVNIDGNRYDTPTVVAPQRQLVEERYIGETRYAEPEVVNMPPVYMRNGQQYANQPYPAPGIPQFAAPAPFPVPQNFGYPQPVPQGFGYPAPPPVFGGGYGGPVAANMRPAYQNGYNGGFNTPYGAGCVTSCVGSSSVF